MNKTKIKIWNLFSQSCDGDILSTNESFQDQNLTGWKIRAYVFSLHLSGSQRKLYLHYKVEGEILMSEPTWVNNLLNVSRLQCY